MPTTFSIEHDGRHIEVVPESTLTKDCVRAELVGPDGRRSAWRRSPEARRPAWIQAILASKAIWLPVILGLVIALREWRRRRAAGTHPGRGGDDAEGGPPPGPDQQPGQGAVP